MRDMFCPLSLSVRCASHCVQHKFKIGFLHEPCEACLAEGEEPSPDADDAVEPAVNGEAGRAAKGAKQPGFACHGLVGGAICMVGEDEFAVHFGSSKDHKLLVKLSGPATKHLRYLSIALTRTEGSRTDPKPVGDKMHNVELFRIPPQPTTKAPFGCVAALDTDKLVGAALSHFVVTILLPGQQLRASRSLT